MTKECNENEEDDRKMPATLAPNDDDQQNPNHNKSCSPTSIPASSPDSGLITQAEDDQSVKAPSHRKHLFPTSERQRDGDNNNNDKRNSNNNESSFFVDDEVSNRNVDNDEGEENDDSSLSSSSSTDDDMNEDDEDKSSDENEETLMEKVARNRKRNEDFLKALSEKYKGKIPERGRLRSKKLEKEKGGDGENKERDQTLASARRIGMLRLDKLTKCRALTEATSSFFGLPERMNLLLEKYPGREKQIRRLTSILLSTTGQLNRAMSFDCRPATATNNTIHVPAPIVVVGPRGSGKTSVVCDVVQSIKTHLKKPNGKTPKPPSPVGYAYINCVTLDPYSIEGLVFEAYSQLQPIECLEQKKTGRNKRKFDDEDIFSDDYSSDSEAEIDEGKSTSEQLAGEEKDKQRRPRRKKASIQRRVQPTRAVKVTSSSQTTRISIRDVEDESVDILFGLSAVTSLGRSLNPFYGEGSNRCAVLVIDNAELLLSLSTRRLTKQTRTNYLAELLLLPKVMRLNLTVVVISRYSNIDALRLNNITAATKSLSTIASGLQPILIQFPAYKGMHVITKILQTEPVIQLTLGDDYTKNKMMAQKLDGNRIEFRKGVMEAFHASLVQYLSDSTKDMHDYLRLGRSYWPVFIEPLSQNRVRYTVEIIRQRKKKSTVKGPLTNADYVQYLQQTFFNFISTMPGTIIGTPVDSPIMPHPSNKDHNENKRSTMMQSAGAISPLPYFRSFLLLSAFICQRNRPEQDSRFFSTQRNSSKRRRGGTTSKNQPENDDNTAAYASDLSQLQSLRPRTFPLERVFSIFESLLTLNPCTEGPLVTKRDVGEYELGSTRLNDDLAQLTDMGLLHRAGFACAVKGEQINFNEAKLWCSLTKEEAMHVAKGVNVDLKSFII